MVIKTAIVNVVATATLDQKLDLDELGRLKEILHDPEIYGGLVAYFKSSEMKGRVSIFSSGKMISVGTTSEEQAIRELEGAKEFMVRKGFVKPVALRCKIQNIVVLANFGHSVDLENLSKDYKLIYEPEQFPGAILKVHKPCKATLLIYASGKAVLTGLKSSDQIKPLIEKIEDIVKKYAY